MFDFILFFEHGTRISIIIVIIKLLHNLNFVMNIYFKKLKKKQIVINNKVIRLI